MSSPCTYILLADNITAKVDKDRETNTLTIEIEDLKLKKHFLSVNIIKIPGFITCK